MEVRKCAKCNATSKDEPNLRFHRFPLPSKQGPLKARIWAEYCYPGEDWSTESKLKSLYQQHVMLCSQHFDDSSYTNKESLSRFAIPIGTQGLMLKLREKLCATSSGTINTNNPVKEIQNTTKTDKVERTPDETCFAAPSTELYQPSATKMFDVHACRACLNTECKLEKISAVFKHIFLSLTGLEIKKGDGYPQYLCMECHTQVKKALDFRKKCRQADFAMKELMIDKKQVSLEDLTAIDRENANLISSLGTTRCRIETDIRPADCYDKEESDLKEDIYLDVLETEEEELVENNVEEFQNFESVYGELKADSVEEENEVEEIVIENLTKQKETPMSMKKGRGSINFKTFHRTFEHAQITYVPLEQQLVNFQRRVDSQPFSSALYKCAICVSVFDFYDALVEHVNKMHNFVSNGHSCDVCKWLFETEEELVVHKAHTHWYEYRSDLCACTHYTLEEHVKCYEKQVNNRRRGKGMKLSVAASFTRAALSQEEMSTTLRCGAVEYTCRLCNMGFMEKQPYHIHTKLHAEKKYKYVCDVCDVRFNWKQSLRDHLKHCHMYSYTCNHCHQLFMNRSLAWYHITRDCRKCHLYKNKNYVNTTCTLCGKVCRTRAHYLGHVKTKHHHQLYVHHCTLCGISHKSLCDLVRHQVTSHKYIRINDPALGSEEFSCSECGVWFVNKRALETHVVKRGHDAAQHVELACALCKVLFKDEDQMNAHLGICRYTRYPQKCIYCEQMLHDKDAYQSHYRKKHKNRNYIPANPYTRSSSSAICELCGKSYRTTKLKSHMLLQHSNSSKQLPYTCKQCKTPRGFTTGALFVSHILASHSHKPYHCALCPAQFKTKCECRDHILKVHEPERPYACGECSRTFAHQDFLNDHSLKAHNLQLKAGRNIQLAKKIKGKITVYPDMKIDVSNIERNLLSQIDIYLCDYMDENIRAVQENTDYFIFQTPGETETARKRKNDEEDGLNTKIMKNEVYSEENAPVSTNECFSKLGDTVLDDAGNEYKIIIKDNQEHVLIDGVLYKLEIST